MLHGGGAAGLAVHFGTDAATGEGTTAPISHCFQLTQALLQYAPRYMAASHGSWKRSTSDCRPNCPELVAQPIKPAVGAHNPASTWYAAETISTVPTASRISKSCATP